MKKRINNFSEGIEFSSKRPKLKKMIRSKKFNTVRICLGKGLEIKPHPEPYAVFFYIIEGSGVFTSIEGEFILKKGDSIFIKAKKTRGIKALENLVVLGVQDGH